MKLSVAEIKYHWVVWGYEKNELGSSWIN